MITVTPLSVSLSASASTITRGTAITYTSTVLPATASIGSYLWDFGDSIGATSTASAQSHVYATTLSPGTITVTVRVFPVYGSSFTTSMQISIPTQKGSITLSGPSSGTTAYSMATTFSVDVGSTVAVTNVTLDYGDGTTRALGTFTGTKTDTKFYATPSTNGAYTVKASGTDPDGNIVSSSIVLFVAKLTGTLAVSTAGSTTSPTSLTFTLASGQTTALIDRYSWDFGDGSASTSADSTTATSPPHQYTRGVWSAKVTVFPSYGASFVITVTVTIP